MVLARKTIMLRYKTDRSRRHFLLGTAAALFSMSSPPVRAGEVPQPIDTDEWIRRQADKAPLALTFRGHTAEECRKWQGEFAAKLRTLLGPHTPPAKWKTVVRRTIDLED